MIIGESNYALDDNGDRVLIGLTVEETREFLELTKAPASVIPGKSPFADWASPKEMRWLELMSKHANALEKFLLAGNTKH